MKQHNHSIKINLSFNEYIKMLFDLSSKEYINALVDIINYNGFNYTSETLLKEVKEILNTFKITDMKRTNTNNKINHSFEFSALEKNVSKEKFAVGFRTIALVLDLNKYENKKDKVSYLKTELNTPVLKNAVSSFYFSSLFLTKNAIEKMPNIRNYELIKKHPTALFLKDLKQYEFLVFLYAANVYRTGTKSIEYNPTEIKNYFGIEHTHANEYIKNAFESILTKEVILYSSDKNYLMVGKLISSTMYKIEGDQKVKYNLNTDLIQYFTNDEIINNYIKLSSIDLKTFASLSPLERNYMLALLYVGQRAKSTYTKKYKDFILSFQGVGTQNENKSEGAIRKQLSDSKKKLIKVLKIIQNKKAYYIKIEAKTFSIRMHKSRKIINSKVKEIDKK